jgi:hypothetical protein
MVGLLPDLRQRPGWAGLLACLGVGLVFGIVKTDTTASTWVVNSLGVRLVRDPSDLMALMALIPAAGMMAKPSAITTGNKTWRYAALLLASLLVLGDAAAPDRGISCLAVGNGNSIVALAEFGKAYASRDGGLSWQPVTAAANITRGPDCANNPLDQWTSIASPDGKMHYRIIPNISIQSQSEPGGPWKLEYSLKPPNEREKDYIQKTVGGSILFSPEPSGLIFDPTSGNLVLAMGFDGVLVRKPDGSWLEVSVGPYVAHSLETDGLGGILVLLDGELFTAGIVTLIVFSVLGMRVRRRKLDWLGLAGSLILGAGAVAICAPGLDSPDSEIQIVFVGGLLLAGLWALAWAIVAAIRTGWRSLVLIGLALVAGIIFLIPYFLWGYRILPEYYQAALAGTILAATVTLLAPLKKKESVE